MCDKDPEVIKQMFDKISSYYDGMNSFISFGLHKFIKYFSIKLLDIRPNAMILDLCCGTGDFTKIIRKYFRARIIGLDVSEQMIKLAKIKNPKETFIVGDCTNLGFGDGEFDIITMGFGLRNVQNRKKALGEIFRVMKNDAEFLHLDFGYNNLAGKIFDIYAQFAAKILMKDEKSYKYLISSKNSYPNPEELIKEFEDAGFKLKCRRDFLFGALSAIVMKK